MSNPMYEWDCPNCGERISSAVLPPKWERPVEPLQRLFNAVRQVITEGMDHPGVRDELHLAFYEVRDWPLSPPTPPQVPPKVGP